LLDDLRSGDFQSVRITALAIAKTVSVGMLFAALIRQKYRHRTSIR
jgi:hypothetical protein